VGRKEDVLRGWPWQSGALDDGPREVSEKVMFINSSGVAMGDLIAVFCGIQG
jgi:hypothetical protein